MASNNTNDATTKTPADFLVKGLEQVQPAYADFEGDMYAGHLPCNNKGRVGETMFWLFEPEKQSVEKTIVLWLNGGPGCSSFNCGVLMEHSPVTQPLHDAGYCCLEPTPEMSYNEHTWTKATTMLYVEHPIGTGFSYGHPYPENEQQASGDLDAFLQNFLQVFERFQDYDLFVFGESYAGMFIPSIARYIHLANQKASRDIQVRLKGAAIGNGWMDAKVQGPACIDYSWWHGLIDEPTRNALHTEFDNCMKRFDEHSNTEDTMEPAPFHQYNVQDDCGIMWGILEAAGNPNAYDITTWDPNVDQITFTSEEFYNTDAVKTALHAPSNVTWHGCRQGEGRRRMMAQSRQLYMMQDRPWSVVPYVADVLDAGIPVLVYNGDRDMTTNMVGSERLLNKMEWSGQSEWLDAPRGLWKVNEYPAGWAKEYKGLTFAVVYNSGHMVPYNAPKSAFDLLTRFLQQQSFIDDEAPLIRVNSITKRGPAASTKASKTSQEASLEDTLGVPILAEVRQSFVAVNGGSSRGWETMGVAAVSMFAGFILAVLLGRRRGRGYYRVPNAAGLSQE